MHEWGRSPDLEHRYHVVGPDIRLPTTYFDDLALVQLQDGVVRFDLSVIDGSQELRVLQRLITSVAGAQRLVTGLIEALQDMGVDLSRPLTAKEPLEETDNEYDYD